MHDLRRRTMKEIDALCNVRADLVALVPRELGVLFVEAVEQCTAFAQLGDNACRISPGCPHEENQMWVPESHEDPKFTREITRAPAIPWYANLLHCHIRP